MYIVETSEVQAILAEVRKLRNDVATCAKDQMEMEERIFLLEQERDSLASRLDDVEKDNVWLWSQV